MKLFREGDKSKAFCKSCARIVGTTFARRDVPFSDDAKMVAKEILVGVCDVCGSTVSIPAQSTPAISKVRKEKAESIEARLPAIYVDVLDYAAHSIDVEASTEFRKTLLTFFVHRAANRSEAASSLISSHEKAKLEFPEIRGGTRRRLSLKVAPRINEDFRNLTIGTKLTTTEIIKSVVYEIRGDVLENPKPELISQLRTISAVSM